LRLALLGYGNVAKALAGLLRQQRHRYPFRVTGIQTAKHGAAFGPDLLSEPIRFGPPAPSVGEFLDRAQADVLVELTPLNPLTGQPAITHIRAAFARRMHVVTANKGPIAHAYSALEAEAERAGVQFRFEATVMDGAPVFSLVRQTLPALQVLGFTGVLNSTSQIAIQAMRQGFTLEEGIEKARQLGVAEADASYDIDGWDAAAKTAALANVLMNAQITPQQIPTRGIRRLTPEKLAALAAKRKTVCLVSRARRLPSGIRLRVRAEVVPESDLLACLPETSNALLLHTDLLGTIGILSVSPALEQTAYGVFADLVDILRHNSPALPDSPTPTAW
jgi:homoserine dehydrogenase